MRNNQPVVYAAQSKVHFYCRDAVCEYIFRAGGIPLSPFRAFDYYLNDRVDRNLVREGNRRLLERCDEVWVFGNTLADGVIIEIAQAALCGLPVRYFTIDASADSITVVPYENLDVENEVVLNTGLARNTILDSIAKGEIDSVIAALGRHSEIAGTRSDRL